MFVGTLSTPTVPGDCLQLNVWEEASTAWLSVGLLEYVNSERGGRVRDRPGLM